MSALISQSLLKLMAIESVMLSNHLLLYCPLLLLLSNFPSIRVFSNESTLCISWPKYWSFSFSISPSNEYSGLLSFRVDRLYLCCPRDSQESSPARQFKSINSLAFSLLYGPTLTSTHNYWKKHSFDYTDLCWQSDVSAFAYAIKVCHPFPSKEQASFNFMAAVTNCSDFGTPKK